MFSRRTLLKAGLASTLGGLVSRAAPAAKSPAVVLVWVGGGFGASHVAADTMRGSFSLGDDNILDLGTGFAVDKSTLGLLGPSTLSRLAVIGVDHGMTAHDPATNAMFNGARNYALSLAAAMTSASPIRCATVGGVPAPFGAVPGATLSTIHDIDTAMRVLVGGNDSADPERSLMAAGLKTSYRLSKSMIEANPNMLRSHAEGYETIVAGLSAPTLSLDWAGISNAYGLAPGTTQVTNITSQFAAAELLVTANVPVVMVTPPATQKCTEAGWDTHGDESGNCFRGLWNELVTPSLNTFLARTLAMDREVTTVILGEFARDPSLSDHARCLSAAVFGNNVKPGSSGRARSVANKTRMPDGTPGISQLWAFLAAVARAPGAPFGPNPHPFVLTA